MAAEHATTVTIQSLLDSGAIVGHKDGNFGSQYPRVEEFGSVGVPFLTAKSLSNGAIDIEGAPRLADDKASALRFGFVEPGDVLLSHNATIGRVAVVPEFNGRALIGTSLTYFRVNPSKISPRYLAAYFSGRAFQEELAAVMSHSTRNQVPITAQRRLRVVIPPLPVQGAIANVLGTLDEKIQLNRQMSRTLEAIARAIFKAWFVDFEPVRAKAEGRDPGLPKEAADLFPSSFEDSEWGEIPKGWKVGRLGDVAEHPRRSVQPEHLEPDLPYIALEHMPRRSILLSDWSTADGLESNKFEFKKGELLFGKLRPYFHKVGVAPVDGVCSTDIVVVAPKSSLWFGFVLGHVSSEAFVEYANAGSTGTKMPRTSWKDMARYELVIPPSRVAEAFTSCIQSVVDRILAGIHESRALAAMRDALLPKLISGEIRLKHVERIREAV